MTEPRTRPRFPALKPRAGHYESFFAKLSHPGEPLGAWVRYTVHKRPGAAAVGSLWFTLFDGAADGPRASKVSLPPARLGSGGGDYIRIGESRFGPDGLSGRARSERCDASWDLRLDGEEAPFRHLPRGWLYRAPVPRTKLLAPHPAARFTGELTVDGRRIDVREWPGTVGHNWGAQHAERWIWLHGSGFEGRPQSTWFDAAFGRIKLGRYITPWIGNACLALDGERHRLGGPERVRSTSVGESPTSCRFALPGRGLTVEGAVEADAKDFVGWVYADPDGSEHNTVNCSITRLSLRVVRERGEPLELETAHGAAYELGMRERDHGIPVQPFPDG